MTRGQQLLIVQPTVVAMVYAANSKPGCYTGHWQVAAPRQAFNYVNFLKMQALPGPESIINCIVQPHGPSGVTRFVTVKKLSKLSQIPGLQY